MSMYLQALPSGPAGFPGWAAGLLVGVISSAALWVAQRALARRFRRVARGTVNRADDVLAAALERTQPWFLIWLGSSAGLALVPLPTRLIAPVHAIAVLVIGAQVGLWVSTLGQGAVALLIERRHPREAGGPGAAPRLLLVGVRLVVWSVVTLLVLANLGVNITALVAGLGVGGVAVALALQTILSDVFASLAIAFDKPFEVGHFIVVDGGMGTVEQIGLKTTRVRSLWGEQLVLPNAKLLDSKIQNYRLMRERRIAFEFSVTYQVAPETLRAIPTLIRDIVEAQDEVRFDRAHFKQLGDSGLVFEIVYWMLDPDYTRYMDAQQEINFRIFEELQQHGVDFAYPTQTVHLAGARVA